MSKTHKKKQPIKKPGTKGSWTEDSYKGELIHFRRVLRTTFNFTNRLRRNKVRNPDQLKVLLGEVQTHANNVIQMFPAGGKFNTPRITALEKKREQIERQIEAARKMAA